MSRSRWQEPNLARAPFVNERPVRRLAVTLWVLFAVVGGLGVWQSRASRQQTSDRLAELVRLNSETVAARDRAAALEKELRGADLPAQNERTAFLNRRLAERSFSWGRLLESLTEAMPRGVRLIRLSPEGFVSERRRGAANPRTAATTRVALRISGEAEETEALLEFVDRLFQHPAFDRPNLSRESEKKDSRIQFELAVTYLPEAAGHEADAASGTAPLATSVTLPPDRQPGGAGSARVVSGGAAASAAAPAGSTGVALPGKAAAPATTVAGRPAPGARPASAASAWGDGATAGSGGKAEPASPGAPVPAGGGRVFGAPAGAAPTIGSGVAGGSRPPGAAPPADAGARFPANVMPTPLRPYASSAGGGR